MVVPDFKNSQGLWMMEVLPRTEIRKITTAYSHYGSMRSRTTKGTKESLRRPNYELVSNSFKDFQEFAEWCQSQTGYACGFHLDKDLLDKSAMTYSKETCVFLPPELNILLIKRERGRGKSPVGVCAHKDTGKFLSQCAARRGRQVYLGLHTTEEGAFNAYKKFKESFIKEQANKWKDQIDPRAYAALMNYEVSIDD